MISVCALQKEYCRYCRAELNEMIQREYCRDCRAELNDMIQIVIVHYNKIHLVLFANVQFIVLLKSAQWQPLKSFSTYYKDNAQSVELWNVIWVNFVHQSKLLQVIFNAMSCIS